MSPIRKKSVPRPNPASPGWTFLSNHAHVLICLREQPDMTVRAVAARVGITERAVQRIISELAEAGFVTWRKFGRQNVYTVHPDRPLRHQVEAHRTVGDLLNMVLPRPREPGGGVHRDRGE
jgi:hypothetical protein